MNLKQVLAGEQIKYQKPISIIRERLNWMGIKAETEIFVSPRYPTGWEATVGANNRIYIFTNNRGRLSLDVQPLLGFWPNGKPIIKGKNNL